jgi:streptogramin lyase
VIHTAILLHRLLAILVLTAAAAVPAAAAPSRAYPLDNPAQVLVLKDGALLVAERGTHDRLLRVNPTTGATTVFARGIDEPWGLAYARDGSLLASGLGGLYRVRAHTRPVRIATLSVAPFALLPDGRIAYANESSVGLLAGGKAHAWPLAVNVPHGLAVLPDGAIALSDTGNNRILRLDPATEASTVVTTAVSTALGLAAEPAGTLLTVEYRSGRLLRVDPSGAVAVAARGLHTPYALARAANGTVFVTEAGQVPRPTGGIRRVLPDGRSSLLRLQVPR